MTPDIAFISQPTRRSILRLIWQTERTAGDIAESLPVTFGAVSQHLSALRKAGLVRLRRDGRVHWYVAEREAFGLFAPALEEMWFGKLGELKRLAEAEQGRIDRAKTN